MGTKNSGKITSLRIFVFAFLTIILLAPVRGISSDTTRLIKGKNLIYIQFSGKSSVQSINYEHIFKQARKLNYSYSIGFSPMGRDMSVPMSFRAFTKGSHHHFEAGLEITPYFASHNFDNKDHEHHIDKQIYFTPGIAYRYENISHGLFLRAGIGAPVFMDPPRYNVADFAPEMSPICGQLAIGISF